MRPRAVSRAASRPLIPPGRITELLAQSRTAHQQYRRLSADSQNKNLPNMGALMRSALLARLDAQTLDPARTDPAWQVDAAAMKGQTHDSLVRFYGRYLAPKEAGISA